MAPVAGAPWTGPSAKDMIASHTLAQEVMTRHDDPCPVFDGPSLALLQRFVNNPAGSAQILQDHDMLDQPGEKPGAAAIKKGNLVGYVIARHLDATAQDEAAQEPVLLTSEIVALRSWFEDGKADERIAADMDL